MSLAKIGAIAASLALAAAPALAAPTVAGGGDATQALSDCNTDLRLLNPLTGWQARWPQQLAGLAAAPAPVQQVALDDWRGAPAALHADIEALRARTNAPAHVARRILTQVQALQAGPIAPQLTDPQWRALLDGPLKDAVADYARFLSQGYLPKAPAGSGLALDREGQACFLLAATRWTSLALTADQIEATGRRLLAERRARLAELSGVAEADLAPVLEGLRAGEQTPTTRDDILRISRAALERARMAAPDWFDLPDAPPINLEPIPASLEADLPAGYYQPATAQTPATYRVNLSRPQDRRLMAQVIAFHETIPGHHLGFSAARAPGQFNSGFVEGWGVYAEHLAEEMGLYSDRQALIGSAAKDLWGASRLIVEPGLHVRGWSRDQAVAFMLENTALSRAEIEVEVDRYLALPGQSLSYMLGYDAIRQARERTQARQGAAFDIKAFHKALLSPGSRPLSDLTLP
ncbi:DUF885 domain-containing protein [Caulobacter sp. NIBR2454]|uniref:DUF885 domain-containing protein n=1 Tax=Caulobacter sp. NIBR2454 TaxID=3015996 RepID=UPI0022B6EE7B|nr:DUF885 domain-containing protein [Caulobacter sp. NIBR2454]